MTKLQCNVTNCANNSNNQCCMPKIDVNGPCACVSGQTCCSSFVEKSSMSAQNSTGYITPNQSLDIACDACHCTHYEDGKCSADSINMSNCGCGCADCKSDTQCQSFRCK